MRDVYPGIDLTYYGRQGRLEYDFLVRPGADPSRISLHFAGAHHLRLERSGALRLELARGTLRQLPPRIYQQLGDTRRSIASGFVLRGDRVGFEVGGYDRTRTLVIDPTLLYSTYLGGGGNDAGNGIAVDAAGSAYVTGTTDSTDFPTAQPYQHANAGYSDVFVTKLSPSGSELIYSTYLGGGGDDLGNSITIDAAGSAYVTGQTCSADFPIFHPYQVTGDCDAFVTKLDPSGSALDYSTYLGGSSYDFASGIALDSAGAAYVTGGTISRDFPTLNAY